MNTNLILFGEEASEEQIAALASEITQKMMASIRVGHPSLTIPALHRAVIAWIGVATAMLGDEQKDRYALLDMFIDSLRSGIDKVYAQFDDGIFNVGAGRG